MTPSHWADHTASWSRIGPPLRPNDEVVAAVLAALDGHRGPTVLLGVTRELAGIAPDLTAVDHDPGVVANVWPGDDDTRRAVVEEWQRLSSLGRRFVAAVGDGSINSMRHPAGQRDLHRELDAVLEPGGRLAVRCFVTPDPCEPLDAVRADALDGRVGGFHAFKWRVAMAAVAEGGGPDIAVVDILAAFDRLFPDRAALADATGWHPDAIATIDVYRGSSEVYSFPTAQQLVDEVPGAWGEPAFVPTGTYELAERCPLLVVDRPR